MYTRMLNERVYVMRLFHRAQQILRTVLNDGVSLRSQPVETIKAIFVLFCADVDQ